MEENYCTFNIRTTHLGNGNVLVHTARTGKSAVLLSSEAEFLLSCQEFESITTHAKRYCQKQNLQQLNSQKGLFSKFIKWLRCYIKREGIDVPVRKQEIEFYQKKLKKWVEAGFLVSKSDLKDEITTLAQHNEVIESERNNITAVGIPTCERPLMLKRCLQSFTNNFNHHSRTPDILILDDSRDEEIQKKNQSILQQLDYQYAGDFYYMNRPQREEFARKLAKKANVNPEVMQFALMGHPSCNRSEGGCRNAFLLLTQGKLALQTDDDTICRIGQPPIVYSELSLTSKSNSDHYWFFQSFEEATKNVDILDVDFLGLHEKVLGKPLETVILSSLKNDELIDIEKLHSSFLENMEMGNSTVRISLVGPVGDTCLFTDLNRLFLEGNALNRLLYPKEAFSWHLSTRQVIRSVTRKTISNFPRCIGMNFAVDNKNLLPPFMPVQARCDGIFGDLLKVCFPKAYEGSLPYVLEHNPPGKRSRSVDDLFSLTKDIRVNDIVAELVHSSEYWPYTENPKKNLQTLGRFMIDLASLKKDDFEKKVRQIYVSRKVAQIQVIEQHLYHNSNDASYLADHLERYIKSLRESILEANFLLPADIDNPKSDNHEDFKEIVLQLGSMLYNWPDLYKTISSFHQDEMLQYITKIGKEKINN